MGQLFDQIPVLPGTYMDLELNSQPDVWLQALQQSAMEDLLPADGVRVAVVGCGTSWFMAQCYAAAREAAGKGVTDAFAASEAPNLLNRGYDAVVTITRSGTTTEVLQLLSERADRSELAGATRVCSPSALTGSLPWRAHRRWSVRCGRSLKSSRVRRSRRCRSASQVLRVRPPAGRV